MEHRTTVVQLTMEPTDLLMTVQDWADKSRFALYEKRENRTIYSKKILLVKAWLSVENNGENARIEAWLSGPNVGPDFAGNAWRGWKTALPQGFGFGAPFTYRKKFDMLLNLLRSKIPDVPGQNLFQEEGNSQPVLSKSALAKGFAILGVILFVMGGLNVFSGTSLLLLKTAFPSLAKSILTDGIFGITIGALIFASSRALAKGKVWAVWLYGGSIIADAIYNIVVGRPMNYFFMGFGLLFIWQMLKFRNEWKLS